MNPAIAAKGNSFKGAIQYITHDIQADTTERVSETATLNMRTDDPEKAAKVMAWTAAHANDLKRAAGLAATGQKTRDPVYHFVLTWEPSQRPEFQEMREAAVSALKELGFEGHEAVLAGHDDKAHAHIHIVVNRINPETGRAVNPKGDYDRMQHWAWQYEKSHGHIYCVDRALRYERDPEIRAELLQRQAEERKNEVGRESKSRPQWKAERDAPYLASKTARDLRDELAVKAKDIAQDGRTQTGRQKAETSALWQDYLGKKAALWERQRSEYAREAAGAVTRVNSPVARAEEQERRDLEGKHDRQWSEVFARDRASERTQIDRLFQAQRAEFRQFLQTSHRDGFVGALATAIQAVRQAKDPGDGRGFFIDVARVLAATLSADKRAKLFLEGQHQERERLRRDIRRSRIPKQRQERDALKAQQVKERQVLKEHQLKRRQVENEQARTTPAFKQTITNLRAHHKAEREELRALYVADKQALVGRHAQERDAQQARWAAFNRERKGAWEQYRRDRNDQAAQRGQKRPDEGLKAKFRGQAPRTADVGRTNTRVARSDVGRGVPAKAKRGLGPSRG